MTETKRKEPERRKGEEPPRQRRREERPEGPHAKPELTNEEATPGAGALPDDADPGGGTSG